MKWVLVKFAVFSFIFLFSNCQVIELNEENFDSYVLLNEKNDWVIKFYAGYCSHCKKMEKDFIDASFKLMGGVQFGAVECPKYPELCRSQKVQGYPTVKFHSRKGFWIDYRGDRSASSLVQFAERNSDQLVKHVSDTDLIKRYTSYHLPTFIVLYPPSLNNNGIKYYKEMLTDISKTENLLCSYFLIDVQDLEMKNRDFDKRIAEQIGLSEIQNEPMIVSVLNNDFQIFTGRHDEVRALTEWLKKNSYRNVIPYNQENMGLISKQEKLIALAIIDIDNLDSLKIRSNFQILARLTNEFFFTWVNINDNPNLRKRFTIHADDAPQVIVIDLQSHSYWKQTKDHSNESTNDIFLFLEDVKNNQVEKKMYRDTSSFVQFLFESWVWILIIIAIFAFAYFKFLKPSINERKSKSILD
ncbi:protein disulfide-isomerase tmx3 [Anaeramoeba flamelloides]|uniref:Protein disulfide-isomerase tmx3 n=1 Tax=Anaeramoeba flamelloides TaxID=1746091 RepID=A0AAV7Y795_9EUKA|nr:protein disulfide-isomerase tmx3 [Anaeramoeba flamelloides]